ncbi:MAG TPA: CusA/CzcA family heavy metal efflux RND transporter [Oligoflexia bacterium]|nr:CusA/CzcA family heavy metal efflux RND transporter [Oligoflexia bacterium]HMP49117.1 CusA/CzcA family heavy metal efflux RND transporter [Oligoflexia bacterium]
MIEKILRFSIHHRLLILLSTMGVGVVGAMSLLKLPIDAVPDITNNQIQINTVYPAFSPFEVEKQLTFPVETALAGIPGLQYTRSLSRNGFSQVTAVFDESVDIYFARQQVGERLVEAREQLPPDAEPRIGPISTGLGEIYMWTVEYKHPDGSSPEGKSGEPGWQPNGGYLTPEGTMLTNSLEKASYLREVQDWVIRPQLRSVSGVAGVDVIGGYVKHYAIEPDPTKLIALNLSFDDLFSSLERNNLSTGAGYVEHRGEAYIVRAASRITQPEEIGEIVITERGGRPIRIKDVAKISVGKELRTGSASENGHEVVVGTALMLIGENSRAVAKAVDEKLKEINKSLPSDIIAKTVLNRTKLVDATISTVQKNLAEGAILVIVVLFVLLGNFKAAIITALAIPLSMLMTAFGMVQFKISGNLMSLGAVDFGLIIDGAVIIVENCLRRLAHKQEELGRTLRLDERLQVVFEAAKEVRQATMFGELIIMVVYFPILTLTGIEGKMFYPMAFTVILALFAAMVLSVTFIPAMVALLVTGRVSEKENFLIVISKRLYGPALKWSLRFRYPVVGAATLAFLLSLLLFGRLGQEFIPTLDEKDLALQAMRIPSTSLSQSQAMQFELEKKVSLFKEVAFVFSKTGTAEVAADPMPPNISDTFVIFKPQEEWPDPSLTKVELLAKIEEAVEDLPGNNYEFTQPIQMRFNELIAGVRGDVAVKIFGDDFEKLIPTAKEIFNILQKIPGASGVKVEQVTGLPILDIQIDRQKISRLGIDAKNIQDVVAAAVGGKESGFIFQGDRRFDLVVRLPEKLRGDLDSLNGLPIPIPERRYEESEEDLQISQDLQPRPRFVPLGSITTIKVVEGPNQISREDGKRRIVVQANVRGTDIGSFVAKAQAETANIKIPPGYWLKWGGQFENLVAAKTRLLVVVPICFFFIFLLLYSTFNSVKQALMVFSGVPLALSGGIVALWLRDMPFSISAAVGFIALSGVAVLNGLVMVSFINQLREEGKQLHDAITEGALTRLRPVLMTALVASLGFVPMALATGTGAEVQKPIATVVIGGLITATFLTLLVLPALYSLFHNEKHDR